MNRKGALKMNSQVEVVVIEEGFSFTKETTEIIPGLVRLELYREEEAPTDASLFIGENAIHFGWTSEAERLFNENIDVAEVIELLCVLATPSHYKA